MTDLAHDDPVIGPCVVTFDGRVLELFTEREASTARLIVGMLHVQVDEPDRKGRRDVWFTCGPNRRGGGFRLVLEAQRWPGFELWLREVVDAT